MQHNNEFRARRIKVGEMQCLVTPHKKAHVLLDHGGRRKTAALLGSPLPLMNEIYEYVNNQTVYLLVPYR